MRYNHAPCSIGGWLGICAICLGAYAACVSAQTGQVYRRLPDDPIVGLRTEDGGARRGQAVFPKFAETAAPTQLFSHGDPTDQEQLMLEMINRARSDPPAEGIRLASTTDPDVLGAYSYFNVDTNQLIIDFAAYPVRPPLAFNSNLIASARVHSTDMALNDFQSHTGSDGSDMGDRTEAAGYTGWSSLGENIYAYGESVFYAHAGFNVDWGVSSLGHRENIMNYGNTVYNEVGIGIVSETNSSTSVGPLVTTQDFGKRSSYQYLVGVVYCDSDGDGFYSVGEGVSGVTVMPASGTYYAVTSTSGGYAILLSAETGALSVTISGGGVTAPVTESVTLSNQNIKLDFSVSTNGSSGPAGEGSGNLTNIAVYYESSGYWYVMQSTDTVSSLKFGETGYSPVPADYDGDGQSDLAVYHEASGYWYILPSATYSLAYQKFGEPGYAPVAGDYDGDRKADLAVYHETSGYWYVLYSSNYSLGYLKFGEPGYAPVAEDYDGDGKADLAVYHETSGYWYVLYSSNYSLGYLKFGEPGYAPVAGDYDGDGKADLAVYHETSGYWYVLYSSNYSLGYLKFGEPGYAPVAGDYDGDGKADLAVYHEDSGYWYVLLSGSGSVAYQKLGGLGYTAVGPM